ALPIFERSTSGGAFSTIVSNTATTSTTYSDTGLASATQYTYRVSAINSAGTSSPSNTGSATTSTPPPLPTLPGSPTGLTATTVSSSQIDLSWTAPSGTISGYAIERSTSGGAFSTIVSNTATTSTTYSDTGLASATQYTYRVSAINSAGTSSPSNTGSATTLTPPPLPTPSVSLTGLTATTVSSSQIDLSWTAPSGTISGYAIERSTSGGSFSTIVSNTATTSTTYSDTGLASATQYTYRVSAINSAGTGSSSNTGSATTLTQTLPSDDTFSLVSVSKAVRSQTCQLTGSKGWICSITTTYVQPPLLGSATVYLEQGGSETSLGSITNSGTINNIPRDVDIKIIVSGGFQPITKLIHTPVSQTNYAYTCTVDGCNFTPDSSSNTATPAPTSPGSPTGLTATTVSSSQIDLSWTAPSGTISGYMIERSACGGAFSTIVSNTATTATTYSDTGLASATQYTYRVSAINSAGTGSPSNTGSVTTLTQTLPSDDTFSLVSVSKAVRSQTCQLTGSKGWICSITTTYVQPPLLGSATVYLEQGCSETSLGSITDTGIINNFSRVNDIKFFVSDVLLPITTYIIYQIF